MAVHTISGGNLAASLSMCTISSSDDNPSPRKAHSAACSYATGTASNDITIDKTARKTSVTTASEDSTDSMTNCSRSNMQAVSSLSSDVDEDAVNCVLCLVHALSHCSYHEPSLLVLADFATYDTAVDLFVYQWHQLDTSHQHDDKTQVCVCAR